MGTIDAQLNIKLGELLDNQTELIQRFDNGLDQVETAKNGALTAVNTARDSGVTAVNDAKIEALTALGESGGFVTTTTIGSPGQIGFGVGIAPSDLVTFFGLSPLPGVNDRYSANYGNYEDTSGSVMVFVPKFYYKITVDLNAPYFETKVEISDTPADGFVIHRAFINAGVEQAGFFLDKYQGSNQGGVMVSKRYMDPVSTNSAHNPIAALSTVPANNYAGIFKAVESRGERYATPTAFAYDAVALLALAHAQSATIATAAWMTNEPYAPRGCNNNALKDVNDRNVVYASSGYYSCGQTGGVSDAVFARITHNGQRCGIADINGNMWEVASGFIQKLAGEFYVLKETTDAATLTGHDAALATDNWNTALYDAVTLPYSQTDTQTTIGDGTASVKTGNIDHTSNSYKLDSVSIPQYIGGAPSRFGGDGLWNYARADMCPLVGGAWSAGSLAGVWARHWYSVRGTTSTFVGGRAFLIKGA